jgi:hypothetical protein
VGPGCGVDGGGGGGCSAGAGGGGCCARARGAAAARSAARKAAASRARGMAGGKGGVGWGPRRNAGFRRRTRRPETAVTLRPLQPLLLSAAGGGALRGVGPHLGRLGAMNIAGFSNCQSAAPAAQRARSPCARRRPSPHCPDFARSKGTHIHLLMLIHLQNFPTPHAPRGSPAHHPGPYTLYKALYKARRRARA